MPHTGCSPGAARRSPGHHPASAQDPPRHPPRTESKPSPHYGFRGPRITAPPDLLSVSAAILQPSLLHYSSLYRPGLTPGNHRAFAAAAASPRSALPAGALPSLSLLGLYLTGPFPERPSGTPDSKQQPFPDMSFCCPAVFSPGPCFLGHFTPSLVSTSF